MTLLSDAPEPRSIELPPSSGKGAQWLEIRSRWPIILGCVIGITFGVISLPGAALLIFMKGFEHDFGWTRLQVSFGHTVVIAVLVLTAPLVGWMCDRKGARGAALFSQLAIGCSFLAFSRLGGDVTTFLVLFGCMTVLGAGASTISFARIITANFVHARGLALGLAMSGTGLSNLFLPLLLVPYVAAHGWRSGFVALGFATLAAAPLTFFLLRNAKSSAKGGPADLPGAGAAGVSLADAIRAPVFWLLAGAFFLIALGIGGLSTHFVSMLTDAGLSPVRAGAIASMLGASMIVVRLVTGWLIDRYPASIVTAIMLGIAAVCLLAFAELGAAAALAGAVAFGLAYGSEIDIVGFLTARQFGMRAFGQIYGVLYGAILVGAALSPVGYGMIYQKTGGYVHALQASALLLACAAVLLSLYRRIAAIRSHTSH